MSTTSDTKPPLGAAGPGAPRPATPPVARAPDAPRPATPSVERAPGAPWAATPSVARARGGACVDSRANAAAAASARRALRLAGLAQGLSLLVFFLMAVPLVRAIGAATSLFAAGGVHACWSLVLLSAAASARGERAPPARESLRLAGLALLPLGFVAAERRLQRGLAPRASWPRYLGRSSRGRLRAGQGAG